MMSELEVHRLRALIHDDIEQDQAMKYKDTTISTSETVDADHGLIETRNCTVIHYVGWLRERHDWPGLNARPRPGPGPGFALAEPDPASRLIELMVRGRRRKSSAAVCKCRRDLLNFLQRR
jgi:hypothetical protein